MRAVSAAVAMGMLLAMTAPAQGPESAIDVAVLGPQVGERIPDFSLPDQNGRIWTRETILGPNGALLLFHRSADW